MYPAPFSKFYLEEIDKEAPDRIGQFIGWRIVSSYMENNSVSLQQMLLTDAETIFNTSKYKPKKYPQYPNHTTPNLYKQNNHTIIDREYRNII